MSSRKRQPGMHQWNKLDILSTVDRENACMRNCLHKGNLERIYYRIGFWFSDLEVSNKALICCKELWIIL
jgi:hypothetical protein